MHSTTAKLKYPNIRTLSLLVNNRYIQLWDPHVTGHDNVHSSESRPLQSSLSLALLQLYGWKPIPQRPVSFHPYYLLGLRQCKATGNVGMQQSHSGSCCGTTRVGWLSGWLLNTKGTLPENIKHKHSEIIQFCLVNWESAPLLSCLSYNSHITMNFPLVSDSSTLVHRPLKNLVTGLQKEIKLEVLKL